jgi:hypothetical protein
MLRDLVPIAARVRKHSRCKHQTIIRSTQTAFTEIFETGRDRIERAASNKYDQTTRIPYEVLTVTSKI